MKSRGALVIFVKTPELSSVKTRLAAGIGQEKALEFYNLALEATAAMARKVKSELSNLDLIWAVAEQQGLSSKRWAEFARIFQGEGDLGQRLHSVYSDLTSKYDFVAMIGADSPHINSYKITQAMRLTSEHRDQKFILGKTNDGGFYFFGGGKPLPKSVWVEVEYSTERTAGQLEQKLELLGEIERIELDFDIDTAEDLKCLGNCQDKLLAEQNKVIEWARALA